jgi:hypothetical protein
MTKKTLTKKKKDKTAWECIVDCVSVAVCTFIVTVVYMILVLTLVATLLLMCISFFHNLKQSFHLVVMPFAHRLYNLSNTLTFD